MNSLNLILAFLNAQCNIVANNDGNIVANREETFFFVNKVVSTTPEYATYYTIVVIVQGTVALDTYAVSILDVLQILDAYIGTQDFDGTIEDLLIELQLNR